MNSAFTPANLLEIALRKAVEDPAARPLFFRELLESNVLIIPAGEAPTIVNGTIVEGTKITLTQVAFEEKPAVPFFTSEQRLPANTKYLLLGARAFFEMTRGTTLVMNPGSAYGKGFFPEEVSKLLDGSLFQPQERYVTKQATQVMIGQPSDYPNELVSALGRLYLTLPQVNRAWVAFYHNPTRDTEGGLLIALDAEQQHIDYLAGESGVVVDSIPKRHSFVDFVRYDGRGVTSYFSSQKPFYRKSVVGKLWSKLATGVLKTGQTLHFVVG